VDIIEDAIEDYCYEMGLDADCIRENGGDVISEEEMERGGDVEEGEEPDYIDEDQFVPRSEPEYIP
jgi:hypothetical protein